MEEKVRQAGFGRALRSAREASGMSIRDLSNTTKVQTRYIEALEAEMWTRVPGGVIGRGFVRIIAREIGAESDKLVELYMTSRGEEPPLTRSMPPDTQWKSGRIVPKFGVAAILKVVLIVVIIAAAGFGAWKFLSKPKPAPKPAAVTSVHRLDVKALQNTWVRVKAKGIPEEKMAVGGGETISFDVEEAEVEFPDAAAVQIIWDGTGLKAIAGAGEAAKIKLPKELESFKP